MYFINNILIPGLTTGATYALIALGFNVLYRTTKVLNFANGALVTAGPMLVIVAENKWSLPIGLGYVIAVLGVMILALVEERVAIRPFLQSGTALPWVLSTLGAAIIFAELLARPYNGQAQPFEHGLSTSPLGIGSLRLSPSNLAIILAPLVLLGLLELLYRRTSLGLRLRAVSEDTDGASAIGVSIGRMSQISAGIAAGIALVTGFALAPTQLINPALGINYTFNGFVAAAIGGLGSLGGGVIGGLVVGVAGQAAAVYVGPLYVNAALLAALIAVYLIKPFGIFGKPPVRGV
jgi:branched-chain amino acid transport system permease protein